MHAVNNLMQGPYYSDFADVALAINEPLVNVLLGHVSIRMVNIVLSQHGVQLLDADCQLFICALGHIDWPLLGYGCLREVAAPNGAPNRLGSRPGPSAHPPKKGGKS